MGGTYEYRYRYRSTSRRRYSSIAHPDPSCTTCDGSGTYKVRSYKRESCSECLGYGYLLKSKSDRWEGLMRPRGGFGTSMYLYKRDRYREIECHACDGTGERLVAYLEEVRCVC